MKPAAENMQGAGGLRELWEKEGTYSLGLMKADAGYLGRVGTTAKEIKSLPEFGVVRERMVTIKKAILCKLQLQAELLKPFLERPPLSQQFLRLRKEIGTSLAKWFIAPTAL